MVIAGGPVGPTNPVTNSATDAVSDPVCCANIVLLALIANELLNGIPYGKDFIGIINSH
jgi:hypothetical protein